MATDGILFAKVISGGQTGVDRAALDWAIKHDFPHGGWCPKGRKAEDGVIPDKYRLQETKSANYDQRTQQNVRDSHGTLILNTGALDGGSLKTKDEAEKAGKPCFVVRLDENNAVGMGRAMDWIRTNGITVLNVAGPRESKRPGIYQLASNFLDMLEEIIIAVEKDLVPDELLPWIKHDTWLPRDAMLLLLGIDPDRTAVTKQDTEYGKPEWVFNTGGPWLMGACGQLPTRVETQRLEERMTLLMRTWDSGDHPLNCSPEYFIRWAVGHGFIVRWLEAACDIDLVDAAKIESATVGAGDPEQSGQPAAVKKTNKRGRVPTATNAANKAETVAKELYANINDKNKEDAVKMMANTKFVNKVFPGVSPLGPTELWNPNTRHKVFLNRYGVGFRAIKDAVNRALKSSIRPDQPTRN